MKNGEEKKESEEKSKEKEVEFNLTSLIHCPNLFLFFIFLERFKFPISLFF